MYVQPQPLTSTSGMLMVLRDTEPADAREPGREPDRLALGAAEPEPDDELLELPQQKPPPDLRAGAVHGLTGTGGQ
jgi:hypothetical protein